MKMLAFALPSLVAAFCFIAISSCSKADLAQREQHAQSPKPVAGGALVWAVATEPLCFDPHRSSQQDAVWITRNYIDSLISRNQDGSYAPWLAQSWSITDDGTRYTFNLRTDVHFTDGTPFDANAVKANFDYIVMQASTATASASLLQSLDHTEVVAPYVVRLVMKQADFTMLASLSDVRLGFISPKALAKNSNLCDGGPGLVGTGPFVFSSYQRGGAAVLTRNPDYRWAPANAQHQGAAWLERVTYRFLPAATARMAAITAGQADIAEGMQATDLAASDRTHGFQSLTGPSASTSFALYVNYTVSPADDFHVRRALRDGFDLDAIVSSVYLGAVRRAWSNIGPDNPDYNAELKDTWGNDVKEANRLLDESGWRTRDSEGYRMRDGKRLTLEVGYPGATALDKVDVLLKAIRTALRQNIGLDLDLHRTAASDGALPSWDMPGDESFFYGAIRDPDAGIVDTIGRARRLPEDDRRHKLLAFAQKRAVDEALIVPLVVPSYHLAVRPSVHGVGFGASPDGPASAYDAWVDRQKAPTVESFSPSTSLKQID